MPQPIPHPPGTILSVDCMERTAHLYVLVRTLHKPGEIVLTRAWGPLGKPLRAMHIPYKSDFVAGGIVNHMKQVKAGEGYATTTARAIDLLPLIVGTRSRGQGEIVMDFLGGLGL